MLSSERVVLAVVIVESSYVRGLKFEVDIVEALRSIGIFTGRPVIDELLGVLTRTKQPKGTIGIVVGPTMGNFTPGAINTALEIAEPLEPSELLEPLEQLPTYPIIVTDKARLPKYLINVDTKSFLSVKGGQGLIQELFTPEPSLQELNIIQNHTIKISETGGPGKSSIDEASQHLAQLYSAKAETNIDYDDVYFDEEFDDDVYFDEEVALRSDKVELGQRSSSNQALSHDDSDRSHNKYSEEEMPDESDDDGYNGCGGYNEYGESDRDDLGLDVTGLDGVELGGAGLDGAGLDGVELGGAGLDVLG
ncbi:14889_t:CDS:2 [Dentiscutata heterogama]|uniref:14889_t:CDS:1 n=1 Tax=Dentiscutata heterogama TaxID=1316150 RepID=A0ACA9KT80_9GLOM|nr:14889_t:CDS:2 [Dentiscutata heterogama]